MGEEKIKKCKCFVERNKIPLLLLVLMYAGTLYIGATLLSSNITLDTKKDQIIIQLERK